MITQNRPAFSIKFFLFAIAASILGCTSTPSPRFEQKVLIDGVRIIYSANVNGELEPCGCRSNPTGGLARKWAFFQKEAVNPKNDLIVDSGDLFYQSDVTPPFVKEQWDIQAQALVESYNSLGCDALTPGEKDFASGLSAFEELRKKAHFEFLSANLWRRSPKELFLSPYIIVEKYQKKIGIIGLTDETLGVPPELSVTPALEAAQKYVKLLRPQVDTLIVLSHLGLDGDETLAKEVSGIDAIFGGHTQNYLQEPIVIGNTTIYQTSFRNQHIGIIKEKSHRLVPLDTEFDVVAGHEKENPQFVLVENTKAKIAAANKKAEAELFVPTTSHSPTFQTFVKCAECHQPQYDFYKSTPHARAYQTLVAKNQNYNKDCLKCHTLGMGEFSGWKNAKELVFTATKKPVNPESFATSLPQMQANSFSRYDKAFINVQCEHCHGPADDHPWSGHYKNVVKVETCQKCHTPDQAPQWYGKDGKVSPATFESKKKLVSCPAKK